MKTHDCNFVELKFHVTSELPEIEDCTEFPYFLSSGYQHHSTFCHRNGFVCLDLKTIPLIWRRFDGKPSLICHKSLPVSQELTQMGFSFLFSQKCK